MIQSANHRKFIPVVAVAALVIASLLVMPPFSPTRAETSAAVAVPPALGKPSQPQKPLAIGQGSANLPPPVAEMRDAIISAARTGNFDELLIPIQWNELPPDFGAASVEDTIAAWKKSSPQGTGREWLALLINLLEAPYAVVPQGRDIENAKVYIWPAFGELPLDQLSPALEVEFLRLVSSADAQRMRAAGGYDGYGLAIGADGTWHAFNKIAKPHKMSK